MKTLTNLTVVNVKFEPFDVYAGRPSVLGNPFSIGEHGTRAQVIELYAAYATRRCRQDERFRTKVMECDGKLVGCHCWPEDCHVGVIDKLITWIKGGMV